MGTGYVRADTANNIANGNVIDADDLDNEFNAIEAAFNASTGHTHDGTGEEGAPIEVIGPSQDIVATASVLRPKTTNTVDLGSSVLKYKDAYLAGDLNLGDAATIGGALSVTGTSTLATVSVSGDTTLTGNLTANGNTTLGDADTDTVTVNADIASNLIPSVDDSYDLGAVGSEWRDAYIDGTAYIDTGSIDTATVGTLSVSGNGTVTGDLTVNGSINATINGVSATANALTTARTIALDGDVTGAANFDGSDNITITTTIIDDSHSHVIGDVDGLQAALDAKLSTVDLSSYTGDLNITGDITITSTNALTIPVGTTAERPTAAQGMLRYNTTEEQFEGYNGVEWGVIGGGGLASEQAITASTTQAAIATYAVADYKALELTVLADDGTDRTITKLLVVHDGTTAVATEYGEVNTNTALATFDVDITAGNIRLLATAASSTSTTFTTKAVVFE